MIFQHGSSYFFWLLELFFFAFLSSLKLFLVFISIKKVVHCCFFSISLVVSTKTGGRGEVQRQLFSSFLIEVRPTTNISFYPWKKLLRPNWGGETTRFFNCILPLTVKARKRKIVLDVIPFYYMKNFKRNFAQWWWSCHREGLTPLTLIVLFQTLY